MVGDLQKTVGRNLRAIREDRGLSQEAFADVLEVHRTYYGGVERGERNLTLKSVERIADKVGVGALDLLVGDRGELLGPAPSTAGGGADVVRGRNLRAYFGA